MKSHLIGRLLDVFGPCRILHVGARDVATLNELLLRGCDAWAAGAGTQPHPRWLGSPAWPASLDVLLIEMAQGGDATASIGAALTQAGNVQGLALRAPGQPRHACEAWLFAQGYRRHPAALRFAGDASLGTEGLGELSFYQRVPASDVPAQSDALRASDGRADGRLARYALAANYVRPGDAVLDYNCGSGEGTAVLATQSRGGRYIGLNADGTKTAYARANYAGAGVTFSADTLDAVPEAAFDAIVAIDAIAPGEDWPSMLAALRRVMKPDGRLVLAARGQQVDWPTLAAGVGGIFIIEGHFAQSEPAEVGRQQPRLRQVALTANVAADWHIVVASASPLEDGEARRADFHHPAFAAALAASGAAAVDFGRGYDNPYLYRLMVQMGERLIDDAKLTRLALWVASNARAASADRGAAICVLAYRTLERRDLAEAGDVLRLIADYRDATADVVDNAHVARWRLSLAFVAGRLNELRGDRAAAMACYRSVDGSWDRFSPLLATKTVAAAFFEGRLQLASGDIDAARACFERGLSEALRAASSDSRMIAGDPSQPIPFGLTEMAEVLDMGSQCANAIANLALCERDRGLFWRIVDVKRFGLASWARDLERENLALREELIRARQNATRA